jgi:hypothetical protein
LTVSLVRSRVTLEKPLNQNIHACPECGGLTVRSGQQLGQFIDDQISGTTGFSLQTVLDYLKTGQWNPGTPGTPTPAPTGTTPTGNYSNGSWLGPATAPGSMLDNLAHTNFSAIGAVDWAAVARNYAATHHDGGTVGSSASSRGNIPWGAPIQPSETFALLQKGEFVVNRDASSAHRGLLEAINSGQMPVRHGGGMVNGMQDAFAYAVIAPEMVKAALMQTAATQAIVSKAGGAPNPGILTMLGRFFKGVALGGLGALGINVGGAPTDVSGNKKIVMDLAASQYGWSGKEWDALYAVIMRESGFRNTAQNPTSTAYGMFQFLNGTWAGYGVPKTSDPTQQAVAGLRYIKARYHDPLGALAHEQQYGWYDNGGYLRPGMVGLNGTGKPEPVFTSEQWAIMSQLIAQSVNGRNVGVCQLGCGSQ